MDSERSHGLGIDESRTYYGLRNQAQSCSLTNCAKIKEPANAGQSVLVMTHPLTKRNNCRAVARMGGDKFITLLPHSDNGNEGEEAASRTLEAMARPMALNGYEFVVSTSIGICERGVAHDTTCRVRTLDHLCVTSYAHGSLPSSSSSTGLYSQSLTSWAIRSPYTT